MLLFPIFTALVFLSSFTCSAVLLFCADFLSLYMYLIAFPNLERAASLMSHGLCSSQSSRFEVKGINLGARSHAPCFLKWSL